MALACEPRVLLLDEPVAGVPAGERKDILDTVAALPADVSVLLIEHDMDLVFSFATRMTVLVNGAVLTEGDAGRNRRDDRGQGGLSGPDGGEHMPDALLEVSGLTCGYDDAVVLTDVSFTLQPGHSLALLGRNGTGKTTLHRHPGRRHPSPRRDASPWPGAQSMRCRSHERAAAGIGWVPQERNIFKSLTVDENLTVVARPGAWTEARVYELFPRLAERKRNLGTQLSGGEQQMLAFGRALVLNPRLLLLDEPLEGLAPIIVEELLRAIRRVTRDEGLTVDRRRAAPAHGARRDRRRDRSRSRRHRLPGRQRWAAGRPHAARHLARRRQPLTPLGDTP